MQALNTESSFLVPKKDTSLVLKEGEEEESEMDAKIRKGLEKVKKLDKILLEKCEYEREVKEERRNMEREFQSQVVAVGICSWNLL